MIVASSRVARTSGVAMVFILVGLVTGGHARRPTTMPAVAPAASNRRPAVSQRPLRLQPDAGRLDGRPENN
jgi:hypothetical protein